MQTLTRLTSELRSLKSAFLRRAERSAWVRARWNTRDGRWSGFKLGMADRETILAAEPRKSPENQKLYGDLHELSERAGSLIERIIRSPRWTVITDVLEPVVEWLRELFEYEVWLRFLVHSQPNCFTYPPGESGRHAALFDSGKVTTWIDNYPKVCSDALQALMDEVDTWPERDGESSKPARKNSGKRGNPRLPVSRVTQDRKSKHKGNLTHAESKDPKRRLIANLYTHIQNEKKAGEGCKTLASRLSQRTDLTELAKTAGLGCIDENVVKAAIEAKNREDPGKKKKAKKKRA